MSSPVRALTTATVLRTWWPLAASWLLMGAELPLLAALIARLENPEINLAAFGGVVFPVALLIEAPIIMMLTASTALCHDRDSFTRLRRFAVASGLALASVHALIAYTPLYDLLVVGLLKPPAEIVEPARLGLMIIAPWSLAISDRRFHQGVLIRHGHSRAVGLGTAVRLVTTSSVLFTGYLVGSWNGCAVATAALTFGVCAEMIFARAIVAPVVKGELAATDPNAEPLHLGRLLAFYVPLALTPLFSLATQPISSAALARMPQVVYSMAASSAVFGALFICRSVGIALTEVVVSHAGDPDARRVLGRFARRLGLVTVVLLLLLTATPLSELWFEKVIGLEPHLAALARFSLCFGVFMPGLTVYHSLYQGFLVHRHRTRGITEAVALLLITVTAVLWTGTVLDRWPGLPVALTAFTAGSAVQAGWLWFRARGLEEGNSSPGRK